MEGDVYIPHAAPADADLDLFFRAEQLRTMLLDAPHDMDASLWEPTAADAAKFQSMSLDDQLEFVINNTIRDEKAMEMAGIDPDEWVGMPFKDRMDTRKFYALD